MDRFWSRVPGLASERPGNSAGTKEVSVERVGATLGKRPRTRSGSVRSYAHFVRIPRPLTAAPFDGTFNAGPGQKISAQLDLNSQPVDRCSHNCLRVTVRGSKCRGSEVLCYLRLKLAITPPRTTNLPSILWPSLVSSVVPVPKSQSASR